MAFLPQPPLLCPILGAQRNLPPGPQADNNLERETSRDGLHVRYFSHPSTSQRHAQAFTGSGIFVLVGSTVSFLLAMTWGGLKFPWDSPSVLVPLIVGAMGIVAFFFIEALWLKRPTVSVLIFPQL